MQNAKGNGGRENKIGKKVINFRKVVFKLTHFHTSRANAFGVRKSLTVQICHMPTVLIFLMRPGPSETKLMKSLSGSCQRDTLRGVCPVVRLHTFLPAVHIFTGLTAKWDGTNTSAPPKKACQYCKVCV